MGQTIRSGIVVRAVHGNLMGIEPLQYAHQLRLDGFIVPDHFLVGTGAAGGLRFQVAKNGNRFTGLGDDKRRMPGKGGPVD